MQLSPYKNTTKHTVVQLLPTFCILKWSSHETQSEFYNWFATGSPVMRLHERSDTSLTNETNNNIVEIISVEKTETTPLHLKARHKKTEQENFLQK